MARWDTERNRIGLNGGRRRIEWLCWKIWVQRLDWRKLTEGFLCIGYENFKDL